MRGLFLLVLAVCASVVAGSPESESAHTLFNNNQHALGSLDARVHKCVQALLTDLSARQVQIRLHTAIPQGHSIHFDLVKGNKEVVAELASKHGMSLVGDNNLQLADPTTGSATSTVTAAEAEHQAKDGSRVPAQDQHGALQPTPPPLPKGEAQSKSTQQHDLERRSKSGHPLDAQQRKWYLDNNMAAASKLAPRARAMVEHLVKMMKGWGGGAVVQLTTAVPNGHAVRFMMVEGDTAKLQQLASRCGIKVEGDSLVVPDKDGPQHMVEAKWHSQNPDGHLEVDTPGTEEDGSPKHVQTVETSKRSVVPTLPKPHLKMETQ